MLGADRQSETAVAMPFPHYVNRDFGFYINTSLPPTLRPLSSIDCPFCPTPNSCYHHAYRKRSVITLFFFLLELSC